MDYKNMHGYLTLLIEDEEHYDDRSDIPKYKVI